MSITAYVGLPGSGKSYGVVENVIVPAVKEFRTVYTNIPLNLDEFFRRYKVRPVQFDARDLEENPDWFEQEFELGSILVLDECWRLWPSGQKASSALQQHKSFLAEHRHMVGADGKSTEVVLVTQDLGQLSNWVRLLVEQTFRVEKLVAIGASKKYRVDVYGGAVTGQTPPKSRRLRQIYGTYSKEITFLYSSHTKSQAGAGDETKTDNRGVVWKDWRFAAGALGMVASVFVLYYAGRHFMAFYEPKGAQQPQVAAKAVSVPPNCVLALSNGNDVPECRPYATAFLSSQGVQALPAAAPPPDDSPLRGYDLSIASNLDLGDGAGARYVFAAFKSSRTAYIDVSELQELGYKVEPLSDCLVKLSYHKRVDVVACAAGGDGGNSLVNFDWSVKNNAQAANSAG